MSQRQITISSNGSSHGTVIAIDGVKMENIKSFKLEGNSENPILELTLVVYALKDAVAVEASGEMDVSSETIPV